MNFNDCDVSFWRWARQYARRRGQDRWECKPRNPLIALIAALVDGASAATAANPSDPAELFRLRGECAALGKVLLQQMHEYAPNQRLLKKYLEKMGVGHNGGPSLEV
jgi:hypothetical protein